MPRTRIPSLRLHKSSGLAVVTLNGRDHYLGPHDAPDVQDRYNALVARWIAGGRRPLGETDATQPDGTPALTVEQMAGRYLAHVETAYRKRGKLTTYGVRVKRVLAALVRMYGPLPAAKFGRKEFASLRNLWVEEPGKGGQPRARVTVNYYADAIRQAFRWAAEDGLIPASVPAELAVVRRLQKGRSKARETPARRAPDMDAVRLVQTHCPPVVRALIDVQVLTGMRPGEACAMRPKDVDRSGPIWRYTVDPDIYKTAHVEGAVRIVSIGPKAQAVLRWWVDRAVRLRGQDGAVFVSRAGKPYRPGMYAGIVGRACDRVGLEGAVRWTPNGLRHLAATAIRARYGVEAAQAVLGHSDVKTTQIYAEVDMTTADRVAREMG
jgi:integrase